jgi:hypothetical protein
MEKTLKEIELEIGSIHEAKEVLDRKLNRLIYARQKLQDLDSAEYIKAIPSDLSKISPKQWRWILEAGHHIQGKVRYDFCNSIIEKTGLGVSGFWQETSQSALYINPGQDLGKVLVGYKHIKRHLIPAKVEGHQSTETGIRFAVHGLAEDMTSVLYVHQKGDVTLYVDRWSKPKRFSNFKAFLNWYSVVEKVD